MSHTESPFKGSVIEDLARYGRVEVKRLAYVHKDQFEVSVHHQMANGVVYLLGTVTCWLFGHSGYSNYEFSEEDWEEEKRKLDRFAEVVFREYSLLYSFNEVVRAYR